MKEIKVRLTFLEEVLGTANAEKDIHEKFIASKAPDAPSREQEVEALGVEEVVEKLVFVNERKIPFVLPEGTELSDCQRPLRAQTAQGERISLADSETVPAGSTVEFTIKVLDDSLMKYVIDWLDYGEFNGIGQWRNSGKGRFKWTEITE